MKKSIHLVILFLFIGIVQAAGRTYLYIYPPYPMPAKTSVSAKIYWDNSINFSLNNIRICDLAGSEIQKNGKLKIDKISYWSAYLIWDCSEIPAGIYFLLVRHGDNSKLIKIIINN